MQTTRVPKHPQPKHLLGCKLLVVNHISRKLGMVAQDKDLYTPSLRELSPAFQGQPIRGSTFLALRLSPWVIYTYQPSSHTGTLSNTASLSTPLPPIYFQTLLFHNAVSRTQLWDRGSGNLGGISLGKTTSVCACKVWSHRLWLRLSLHSHRLPPPSPSPMGQSRLSQAKLPGCLKSRQQSLSTDSLQSSRKCISVGLQRQVLRQN